MRFGRIAGGVVAAVGVALSGCGSSCPTESPQVQDVQSCTASPGAQVPVGVQLCPTCNQMLAGCSGSPISSSEILLDPVVEACDSGVCNDPPSCDLNSACTITAPMVPGAYTVSVVANPSVEPPEFVTGTLTVVEASGPASCTF
jgi:hypothetical protein